MKTKPETIDAKTYLTTHRPFDDMQGLVNQLRKLPTVWSWGAHGWTRMNPNVLRFMVKGHHHSGHVYLSPNARDLFDIVLTTSRGTIKQTMTDIHIESLLETIDDAVERIPAYQQ